MDFRWAFELLIAVASVVVDRQLDQDPTKEAQGIFASQFKVSAEETRRHSSRREERMVAVPPGAPVTIGTIMLIPISIFFPFIRRRLIDLGKEGQPAAKLERHRDNQTEEAYDYYYDDNESTTMFPSEISVDPTLVDDASSTPQSQITIDPSGSSSSPENVSNEEREDARSFSSKKSTREYHPWFSVFEEEEEKQLALLDSYFSLLQVDSETCKVKFICEMAVDPERFYPLSDIFLTRLRLVNTALDEPVLRRFGSYLAAARAGFNGAMSNASKCSSSPQPGSENKAVCEVSLDDVVDMDKLGLLKDIGRTINLEFTEYSSA